MVIAALALALLQTPEFSPSIYVERRVDCHATLRQERAQGGYGFPAPADYVFLFLERESGGAHRRRLAYLVTNEEGGTTLDRGFVTAEHGSRWPDFSASLEFPGGTATIASDPHTPRRLVYRGLVTPADLDYRIVGEGTCEIFPRDRNARPS